VRSRGGRRSRAAFIGILPAGILAYPTQLSGFIAGAWTNGALTDPDGVITAAIWDGYVKSLIYFGLLGAWGQSTNLFSATEVAETIGADLETINAWLEVGAIDRAVFGGGRFSKYELQRAALTFELVKFGLSPRSARDVVWEMEHDLQQIWAGTISNQYKAYAIIIPNNQKKWLLIWCWKVSTEEIDPSSQSHIILPISDILARVTNDTEQACQH
jgi:hypothetical protein